MRSVPHNIDRKGEHLSRCDVCGVMYLRSALSRGRDGLLRCDNDRPGRDAITLSELTAKRAAALASKLGLQRPADGAYPDVLPVREANALVAGPPPRLKSVAAVQSSTGVAITFTWPSSHATGDIGLIVFETANLPISTPATMASIPGAAQGIGTPNAVNATSLQVFWKRATFPEANISTGNFAGDHGCGTFILLGGCDDAADPFNVVAGDTVASGTAVSIPGATTTRDNCLVLAISTRDNDLNGSRFSEGANSTFSFFSKIFDDGTVSGNGGGFAIWKGLVLTAGAYGATTATVTSGTPRQAHASIAFAPPLVAGEPVPVNGSYSGIARRRTVEQVYNNEVPTYSSPGTLVNKPGF